MRIVLGTKGTIGARGGATAAMCLSLALPACTVLPVAEANAIKARSTGTFDLAQRLAAIWPARVIQDAAARTVALSKLRTGELDAAARRLGHRSGDGSPPTYFAQGEGIVREVDTAPRGSLSVDTAEGPVTLQIGPVVSGTAIRDALPFVDFDDFPDQISFAEFGMALTDRALGALRPTIAALRPGDRVRFTGAVGIADAGATPVLTPVALDRNPAAARP